MVVIVSKLSGYYFKGFGDWTSDPLQAESFPDEWDARRFIQREHLSDVTIWSRD